MYIFIREDMTTPQQIVQAAHATHHAGIRFGATELPTHFVLVGVQDEEKLMDVAAYLIKHGIAYELFHEPDFGLGHTAIATIPLFGDDRKPMRKFQLLKEKANG